MTDQNIVAGIELGGTKSIALIAEGRSIIDRVAFPTTGPDETLGRLYEVLRAWQRERGFAAIGIASFGPVRVDPEATDFGRILATPKPGWAGAPVADRLGSAFDCPWRLDTDVNAAALAEHRWGSALDAPDMGYTTIGTGVGVGLLIDGQPVHGAMHPEMGHMRIRRRAGDGFAGICPFHGDCVEGLVSGPALEARFGQRPGDVSADHPTWQDVACDLAELVAAILLTVSARRVVIGGGVGITRQHLLPMVRERVVKAVNGYLPFVTAQAMDTIVVPAALGADAGPLGAVTLALDAVAAARV